MKKKYTYSVETGFSDEQLKNIKLNTLASKYEVTPQYVGLLLSGKRLVNTDTAKGILADAKKIIEIIESI